MAKAVKVFQAVANADGSIDVRYNAGQTPLPANWQGDVLTFDSRAHLQAAIVSAQDNVPTETLVMLAIADGWAKRFPDLNRVSDLSPREVQLDLEGATTPIRIKT